MPPIENSLIGEWTGPYEGVPAYGSVKLEDLKPALEWAMEKNLKEVDAIANDPAPANFANTILAT